MQGESVRVLLADYAFQRAWNLFPSNKGHVEVANETFGPDSLPSVNRLKRDEETGLGYQAVSVQLRDGRHFDQAIASEGCIIAVRGYDDVPFTHDEVEYVAVNHKRWNFRENSDVRRYREKSRPGQVISGRDMRKRQIRTLLQSAESSDRAWLDLAENALVEVTSEEKAHPIESALQLDEHDSSGWLAANPGRQVIRIIFDEPQMLRRIWLFSTMRKIHASKSSSCGGRPA